MTGPLLRTLLPEASPAVLALLAARRGPLQPPIRAEIFGEERFARHGRSLGDTHAAGLGGGPTFMPRLQQNIQRLREAQRYLAGRAAAGVDVSPAGEWLLDNFHLIEAQLKAIHDGLPRGFYRGLPLLRNEPLAGLPRIYGVAWAFVAHTDGAFDEDLLVHFLRAYQETRGLQLAEFWALPTTLRVLLVENLRRLAERLAAHQAARELADLCAGQAEPLSAEAMALLHTQLARRGVDAAFNVQMQQRQPGHAGLPDAALHRQQQAAEQTADNLSVSNAVTALRAIGDADWADIVGRASHLMQRLLATPAFAADSADTRDHALHRIERLARRSGRSELAVADALLGLMAPAAQAAGSSAVTAWHWLFGEGQAALLQAIGLSTAPLRWRQALRGRAALPLYLGGIVLGSIAVVAAMLHMLSPAAGAGWLALLMLPLLALPASEAVITLLHRLISECTTPQRLPRLALADGIPAGQRVLVVIPALLADGATVQALARRLLLHALANQEAQAQFALLTDPTDAATEHLPSDAPLLAAALAQIDTLNREHPAPDGQPPRFLLLHRGRRYSASERAWIGWERKRGKLEVLIDALARNSSEAFAALGEASRIAADTRFIVTLDSDTVLPPGRLRELVGVATHPCNLPRLDAAGRRIEGGYAILQPRIVVPLPDAAARTPYHALFAGPGGIDPYSAASSDVYQDLFDEGSFSGKGLLHVDALQALLNGRLPEGRVLSHDLLEGALTRCAALSDVTLVEDAPAQPEVADARLHRWLRGDWQLLPFLLQPRRWPMRGINRWKLLDNLRRSLVAPASLALLVLALSGAAGPAMAAVGLLGLVALAFGGGPVLGALAALLPGRAHLAWRHFYRQALIELARALGATAWHLAALLHQALLALDAMARALWRLLASRRHLLQWTTAAATLAARHHGHGLPAMLRRQWRTPAASALLLAALLLQGTPWPATATLACLAWGAAPLWMAWAGRPRRWGADMTPDADDQAYLLGVARDTWRLFERCIGPQDHHLPPDNLQVLPHETLARRTSPTNIGLYLLATACARQFGWIGTQELLQRLEATAATLDRLQRHRGHFLNWYDTGTGEPLLPMYVSSVDSGNFSGHLLAVAQACLALAAEPPGHAPARAALRASARRLAPLRRQWPPALQRLLGLPDALADLVLDAPGCGALLSDVEAQVQALLAAEHAPHQAGPAVPRPGASAAAAAGSPADHTAAAAITGTPAERLAWLVADHLATLRSAALDDCLPGDAGPPAAADTAARLQSLARRFTALAWAPDYAFLYDGRRHLFHIGYRVAEQQLDASYYDLLASESRLTSLLAIAKGDVPVRHWAALGRPFFASGPDVGLRSWSGSMFEYLMPGLVLDEPRASVLDEACRTALAEQRLWAAACHLPWGISESAYAGRDHTLAYQYAPQGVARLALRRTPLEERVIAPYATALGATLAPMLACRNFARMALLGARGRYGFIEALDFSPGRLAGGEAVALVGTYMAHHQGMTVVALAQVLLGAPARRWMMAEPAIEAVASLLHERAPQAVPTRHSVPAAPAAALHQRTSALLREVAPGQLAIAPTHLLSNGRYQVSIRANGAGASRWGAWGLTRTRDDALRDACGSFFYLQRAGGGPPVSLTQHPAPDEAAQYDCTFHTDRVTLAAEWPDLHSQVTVWVSPEDDIEFRQVSLHNLGERSITLQLSSAFEPTLNTDRADEAHPAFANLFMRAEWLPAQQAVLFERQPRLATERGLQLAHFVAGMESGGGAELLGTALQTDRQRWLGRNRGAAAPQAQLDTPPEPGDDGRTLLPTGLDPMCALGLRLRIPPGGKAEVTFATAAGDDGAMLRAVVDKYRQASSVKRALLMSATLGGIRLRSLQQSADTLAAIQLLTTALLSHLSKARPLALPPAAVAGVDRRLLWRFGLSGDLPIVLVSAAALQDMALLRPLAQALRLWAWGGVACDLVVINAEPASYQLSLQQALAGLRDEAGDIHGGLPGSAAGAPAGLHLLRADALSAAEAATLHTLARVHLQADGRTLADQVQSWATSHEDARSRRQAVAITALAPCRQPAAVAGGHFEAGGACFGFEVSARSRPPRPWINVLSNPGFGAQLSEAGGGYTWAGNSRMHQLTPWSNDPVTDPVGEWFLLQDMKTLAVWSATPSAWGEAGLTYQVTHTQGETRIAHRRGELEVTVSWCVDAATAVKQVRFSLMNHGSRPLQLRLAGLMEWQLGAGRSERATVHTACHTVRQGRAKLHALLATQADDQAGFGGATAFFTATASPFEADEDWTCDRRECFDARGHPVLPDHFGQAAGHGLDPCAGLSMQLLLPPGQGAERSFLLGHADSAEAALALAVAAAAVPPAERLAAALAPWEELLGAVTVATPDPLFDAMVNRWLLYQAVGCRLWAKAGFYQAGGATGFRDQLQDAMALAWAAPQMLRAQILQCAGRQYPEGDVQHWWHSPRGAGVRSHCSDDLLWLAQACVHYLRSTGDAALMDEVMPFLHGNDIPPGAEDLYETPAVGEQQASLYEHAARGIDRSLRVGVHGLPLMGSGDWNDGMNRVGHEGRGESVWLAWFLCRLVADFAPIAAARGDAARVHRWEQAALGWRAALRGPAWDGHWFRRAFFDDGQPLGSQANAEGRIDLIAQAWSVLSAVAAPDRQQQAMAAVDEHLADHAGGLMRLLSPPLVAQQPSAGYIQAYPPGVRENGGQYSHAGVWALMAQAALGDGDAAYRSFTWLSPAHRSAHAERGAAYGLEPYAMAGDVYTQPPYIGRGGWSWYTGAAAWMHRAAIESIFGLTQQAQVLCFQPCLPAHWPQASMTLRRDGRALHFLLRRGDAQALQAAALAEGARLLQRGERLHWQGLPDGSRYLVPAA